MIFEKKSISFSNFQKNFDLKNSKKCLMGRKRAKIFGIGSLKARLKTDFKRVRASGSARLHRYSRVLWIVNILEGSLYFSVNDFYFFERQTL